LELDRERREPRSDRRRLGGSGLAGAAEALAISSVKNLPRLDESVGRVSADRSLWSQLVVDGLRNQWL
jgi:hypothetical protein